MTFKIYDNGNKKFDYFLPVKLTFTSIDIIAKESFPTVREAFLFVDSLDNLYPAKGFTRATFLAPVLDSSC